MDLNGVAFILFVSEIFKVNRNHTYSQSIYKKKKETKKHSA